MQSLRHSLAVRRLVRSRLSAYGETSRWSDMTNRLFPQETLNRLLSSSPSWVNGWLDKLRIAHPPPEKYLPGNGPATADSIYQRMLVVGDHRNKLSRVALHYLLRACHQPADIETAQNALKLYQSKAIEISEETALLYVKSCCRVGEPLSALKGFLDPSMRVGLWSNATAWNYLMIKLDNATINPKDLLSDNSSSDVDEESVEGQEVSAVLLAFDEMLRLGVKPNSQTYHVVIRALLLAGDKSGVESMLARANAEGKLQQSTSSMAKEGAVNDKTSHLVEQSEDYVDEAAFPPEAQAFAK